MRSRAIAAASIAASFALLGAAAVPPPADGPAVTRSPGVTVLEAPAAPTRAVRLYDPPAEPWAAGHRGIDLAARRGQAVLAPGPGVVAFAGRVASRGVVTIDHGGGWVSSLEPVGSRPRAGTVVATGDPVGIVGEGNGHCTRAPCLHWGVRVAGAYVDPLDVLAGFGPVVLLPPG